MPTVVATPGAANANSYLTRSEGDTYYSTRLFGDIWTSATSDTKDTALIMATRTLDKLLQPYKTLIRGADGVAYYRVRPEWTGLPATTTQVLAWPRSGMYDGNGNAIATTVIPQALKDATAEFAGQLIRADRTLDNDVIVQGLTSVRAGSVALTFKDEIMPQVIPDAVWNLLVNSWITEELYQMANVAQFDIVSAPSQLWPGDA